MGSPKAVLGTVFILAKDLNLRTVELVRGIHPIVIVLNAMLFEDKLTRNHCRLSERSGSSR